MRILLLNPNYLKRAFTPIGLAMVSACLKRDGHKVDLFDTTFFDVADCNEQEEGESYLSYQPVDMKPYGFIFEKKDEVEEFRNKVEEFQPQLILYSMASSHIHAEGEYNMFYNGKELIRKSGVKNIPVLVGGIIPSAIPEKVIQYDGIQMICLGECEEAVSELVEKMERDQDITSIKNLWIRKGNRIYKNDVRPLQKNLDQLPFMDLSIFDDRYFYRPYKGKVYRTIDAETSRGCLYCCDYCVETIFQRHYKMQKSKNGTRLIDRDYYREKSVERVIAEFRFLKEKYNLEFIRFQDTNFLTMKDKKLEALSERFASEVGLPFYIETRPDSLSPKRVSLLEKAGCVGVGMGLETGSPEFRKRVLNRQYRNDKLIEACHNLKKHGIRATTYNIIGFPGDSRRNVMESIRLNRKARPESVTVAFLSPYIGTELYRKSIESGFIKDEIIFIDNKLLMNRDKYTISNRKLRRIRKVFILYVYAPLVFYPFIRLAEYDSAVSNWLYSVLKGILGRWVFNVKNKEVYRL